MKNGHLTDEVLQAFLLEEILDDSVSEHLSACTKCRKSLEEYKEMINSMQKMNRETFCFDVTILSMNNIILYEKKKSKKQELLFWGLLIFLLITISSFSIPYIDTILAIFLSKSIFTTLFVLGTGLVILLFLLADIRQQYKTKEEKIFKNNLQPIL